MVFNEYFLSLSLNKCRAGKRCHSKDELKMEINTYFGNPNRSGIEMLKYRYNKWFNLDGYYVEA